MHNKAIHNIARLPFSFLGQNLNKTGL